MESLIKTYAGYMAEISPDELYEKLLGYGLFAENLPAMFTSESFMLYMKQNKKGIITQKFINSKNKEQTRHLYTEWVDVDIIRNTVGQRTLSIPNPFAYHNLCLILKEKWIELQKKFRENTKDWRQNKVSRIHIRKRKDSNSLFKMNYNNWHTDGNPNSEWLIGSKYIVRADISACFPSVYTHALTWALMGKETAKKEVVKRKGSRSIDYQSWDELDTYTRYVKNNETNGLLIGPHASNVLSEIILTKIDSELTNWHYVRFIDDYTCYATSYDDAESFISKLSQELRKYNFNLNYKKTKIEKLPDARFGSPHDKIKVDAVMIFPNKEYEKVDNEQSTKKKKGKLKQRYLNYEQVRGYLDKSVELAAASPVDASVINYAIKVLGNAKQFQLNFNAKKYLYNTALYLSAVYPYLLRILDEYVFPVFPEEQDYKKRLAQTILQHAKASNQFEEAYYAICFDIKYQLKIVETDELSDYCQWILGSDDCLLKLTGWLWSKHYHQQNLLEDFLAEAERLARSNSWDRNWLFTYECLSKEKLDELRKLQPVPYKLADEWCELKEKGISFLTKDWRL